MQKNVDRLIHVRILTLFYILALVLSGITAFPLFWETKILCQWFGEGTYAGGRFPGLACWLGYIHEGIAYNATHYPFYAYGTDWLAFSHIVIAVFFVGVLIDPARNIWIVKAGLCACLLVPVLAFSCGRLRGIPLYWQLIDSSFGVFGSIPLLMIHQWIRKGVQPHQ